MVAMKSLSQYQPQKKGKILSFLDEHVAQLLIDRGITLGSYFRIVSRTPFKGPLVVDFESQRISLRYSDAKNIEVE